jgi:hypothetical protein
VTRFYAIRRVDQSRRVTSSAGRRKDLLRRDAERGELFVAKFDEDFLRLLADDVNLVDTRRGEPLNVLGARLEVREAQAIGA